jgi:hypothetical protein
MATSEVTTIQAGQQSLLTNPHGKSRRLTPEESAHLNSHLIELCTQKTPGLDVAKILNEEFGLAWTFEAFFRRAKALNLNLEWIPRARANGKEQPKMIMKCVICGCDYIPRDRRQKTCGHEECQAAIRAQWNAAHRGAPATPERRAEIISGMRAARDAKHDKKYPRWNGESPDTVKNDNPAYENGERFKTFVKKHVICRICGKQVGNIAAHLGKNVHTGIDLAEYKGLYPGAPIYSLKIKKRNRDWHNTDNRINPQRQAGFRANRKARVALALQKAWRPDDWLDKPIEWRIIGTELLSREPMTNRQLGQILDKGRILRCPYGEKWEASVAKADCMKFINKIRKWVNRPGKTSASIPLKPSV